MPTTLSSLPNELLLQICKRLASDTDLSNFRLVCRRFGEVSLPALGTRVTFALLPESINRLRDISSDPVFSGHTTTIVCLMSVFYPYTTVKSLKLSMTKPFTSGNHGNHAAHDVGLSEDDWEDSMMHYGQLLAAQNEAFETLEMSQDIQIACRRFTNLQNLHFREDHFRPDHFRNNQAYQFLSQRHGDLRHCATLPAFNFSVFPHRIALPGVYLLSSLLGAIPESQLRTLQVDALALQVFKEEDEVYSRMKKGIQSLHTLKLCVWATNEDDEKERADQLLSTNRLKNFLCSAPHLEVLEVDINGAFFWTAIYYANSAYILPRDHTWHRLRRLCLSQVELLTSHFLEFLSFHGHTLEYVGLGDCAIVGPPSQGLQRCFWSEIIIPLANTYSLANLSLSGWFMVPPFPMQDPDQEIRVLPAMNMDHDRVKDVNLLVGKAIEMVACSKEFLSLLQAGVGRQNGLTLDTHRSVIQGLVVEIKEGIIRDLMDREPVKPARVETVIVPTRYSDYLKLFTQDDEWGSL
ncbi:unnamed protein product [Clonostachys byssicola]|uniref:F-box domain-containing protein n=1 Tax=Clonostachys byssicola TaxID=160290 RepID=A0A9N9Y2H7_9HYPO|nr:unnamed protein product [Clonostachys byssicola]